ncbi:Rhodanese-like protein [Flagelloscypha sp. PMI_526]|nr:Rhodanese-like protein [Flagelloscypha sp. PMI_526]
MPQYISNHELAALIRNPDNQMRKNIAVVDVRDDDYPGGNIVDVIHSPSATFNLEVNQLIDDLKDVKKVIFHCAFSQQRGPKAARIYEETRENLSSAGSAEFPAQEVLILRDGFHGFQALFKNDAKLVENWDADRWNDDWN